MIYDIFGLLVVLFLVCVICRQAPAAHAIIIRGTRKAPEKYWVIGIKGNEFVKAELSTSARAYEWEQYLKGLGYTTEVI